MLNKILISALVAFNILIGGVVVQDKLSLDIKSWFYKPQTLDNAEYVPPKIKPVDTSLDEDISLDEHVKEIKRPSITDLLPSKPQQVSHTEINLSGVPNFGYLASKVTVSSVANSSYKMLIVNEADKDSKMFTSDDVSKMKKNNKIVLADVSIAIAEKYRWYWSSNWNNKKPSFLGETLDASRVYVKQWWAPEWWKITTGIVDKAIESGYDGVVLSGVDTYIDLGASVNLRNRMSDFVIKISKYAKEKKPGFLILPKNGERLGRSKDYVDAVDGIIKEDLIFASVSNGISGPKNPAIQMARSMNDLYSFKSAGKPAFVIEYVSGSEWSEAKKLLKNNGFIGYSAPSRVPSKIRETTW